MEQYIEYTYQNQIIRGMKHVEPENTQETIFVHGFTGTRGDHHRFMLLLARTLQKMGQNVLRFDFIGSGESDGDFSQMTFQSEFEQLEMILNTYEGKVNLVGFSMGGLLAAKLAGAYPDKIHKLTLLSPAFNLPQVIEECIQNGLSLPNGNYDVYGFEMSHDFVKELKQLLPYHDLEAFKGRVKIVHGSADVVVPPKASEPLLAIYDHVSRVLIQGADHCYTSIAYTEALFNEVTRFLDEDVR